MKNVQDIEKRIETPEYAEFMQGGWLMRHNKSAREYYGVWRWHGMYEYKERIKEVIQGKRVIDMGGADGPLGFGSLIVDKNPRVLGEISTAVFTDDMANLRANSVDVVFSSHTLEHFDSLGAEIEKIWRALTPVGKIIFHLPSVKNMANWHPSKKAGHKRIFALDDHADPAVVRIDTLLELSGFGLPVANYCGDASIMIIGEK